jgi:hypothetical protein
VGGQDHQGAEGGQAQVGQQGVLGQEVEAGDDDAVEEVEEQPKNGCTARWSMAPLMPWRVRISPRSWMTSRMGPR